jgi:pre-rRNA-processing protein TSR1
MLVEKAEFRPTMDGFGTLLVSGYLRGMNLSANQLVHLPDHGDFQLLQARHLLCHKNRSISA